MPDYRSLIGGYYSSTPFDKSIPASIRTNNPGAINGASWLKSWPGYVGTTNLDGTNHATIFEAPEYGVSAWYELMRKYRAAGASTVHGIITRYGGAAQADRYARDYVPDVCRRTGLNPHSVVPLKGDDDTLLKFAKAMFRHEAGRDTPLSDKQILHGFNLARGVAAPAPAAPQRSIWSVVSDFLGRLFRRTPAPSSEPRWLTRARKEIGFRESGNNRGIARYLNRTPGNEGDAWCAHFVNDCLEEEGIPGTRSGMARSFENHKNFVRLSGPAIGAVATFWRGSPAAGAGHVNFYVGTDERGRHLGLGGNQSDSVNVSPMDMSRHTGFWWPKGEPKPVIGPVRVTIAAAERGSES